jgi:protein-glutamine gamma-glutamyltransferase
LYFRGPVLSRFDGRDWRPARFSSFTAFGNKGDSGANLAVSGVPVSYEVTLEPTSRPWLFVMEAATQSPALPGYESAMQADLQWLVNRPITDLVRYRAQSFPTFSHGPASSVLALREFVELPPGFNPRTLALASDIRREPRYANANAAELVQVVLARLRSGGYSYTLEPGVYGQHTADEFWFDRKEGFCEHIASSFVILMRALDIPARIVTGYQGGERNAVDGFWVVRQSDAHAWAEVWQAGVGWVRVDPTSAVAPGRTGAFERLAAPQGLVAQAFGNFSPTLSAQLRAAWDALNNGWNQWVLNYTQGKQLNLLKNLGFESPSWTDLSHLLLGTLVLAALLGAAWTLWDRAQHDPWLRLLTRARKRLAQAGISSTAASTPRQLAERLAERLATRQAGQPNDRLQALHEWLMTLERQRYASPTVSRLPGRQQLKLLKRQFSRLVWPA